MRKTLSCITLLALAGIGNAYGQGIGNSKNNGSDQAEHETFDHAKNAAGGGASSLKIVYRGGPVMTGTVKIYYIWYGNWSGNTAPVILENLAQSIGGSPYYNINSTYYQIAGGATIPVSNSVLFGKSTNDDYSEGKVLTNQKVANIVARAISSGALTSDSDGVYFVLTSSDVTLSGFCSSYCGWHTYGTYTGDGKLIKYAFIGNPDQCPSACAAQTTGPNGNAGADGMASIIAHELEEAHTDPLLNAWYDNRGYENADKCAWTFGTMYTTGNGAKANVNLGGHDYLIQRNWNAQTQACAMAK